MGSQQSTRKITIDNNDPTNIIKVSDAVIDRLRGKTEAVRNKIEKGHVVGHTLPEAPIGVHVGPHVPLYPQYMYEPSQTSLQLRQEHEANLRKNDAYWQSRINELEEKHEKIDKLMEMEYQSAMKEVQEHFTQLPTGGRKPACVEGKRAVMQCYKEHPNEPMKCAREVQAFAECVDQHRAALVTANRG